MNISQMAKNLGGVIFDNSPQILTGLGCAGVGATAALAVKATPTALIIINENGDLENLTRLDVIRLTWKCYIPAAIVGCTSIGCIIGANTISTKRNAALAALYSISEQALREYQNKVMEQIGKNKEKAIRTSIQEDKISRNPPNPSEIIITGNGEVLCYDSYGSGRYFKSDIETIRRTINDLNYQLISDMWISLNEFWYALGLPETTLGNDIGFDIDRGKIEVSYSSHLDPNGTPCLALEYKAYPRQQY